MHQHALYFERVARELQSRLKGAIIKDIFSTNRQELFFHFRTISGSSFNIKLSMQVQQVFLSFPDSIHLNSKNRFSRFQSVWGCSIQKVEAHPMDRSFHLETNTGKRIIFKMHGRNANVILQHTGGTDNELFRKELIGDLDFQIPETNYPGSLDPSSPFFSSKTLSRHFELFVKETVGETEQGINIEERLRLFMRFVEGTHHSKVFIIKNGDMYSLSFWPETGVLAEYTSVLEASDDFVPLYLGSYFFRQKKELLAAHYKKTLKLLQSQLQALEKRLVQPDTGINYKQRGDILMANVHLQQVSLPEISLFDFYNDRQVTIKLNKDLSLQANAERYYRKSKNQKFEKEHLQQRIALVKENIRHNSIALEELEEAQTAKELRRFSLPEKEKKEATEERKPYREFQCMGWQVLVGKGAKENDQLTLKIAGKDDVWLHAKDVNGSHVIIRQKAGQNLPAPVLEYAASLAAWFSKAKNNSLCPVLYTPKKYVRKQKGMAAGKVKVERETVIMVPPVDPNA